MAPFGRIVKHSICKGGTRLLVSLFAKYCNFLKQHVLKIPPPPLPPPPPIKPYILLILIEKRAKHTLFTRLRILRLQVLITTMNCKVQRSQNRPLYRELACIVGSRHGRGKVKIERVKTRMVGEEGGNGVKTVTLPSLHGNFHLSPAL